MTIVTLYFSENSILHKLIIEIQYWPNRHVTIKFIIFHIIFQIFLIISSVQFSITLQLIYN